MPDVDDSELLRRSASGDQRAFAVLFDAHVESVTKYAWALADSRSDVHDIVQDTFVTAWRRAGSIRLGGSSVLPWLLVTCRNHVRNQSRTSRRRREVPLSSAMPDADADPQSQARTQLRWVLDEIGMLDDDDRAICQLCLVEGASYAQAAEEVGRSVAFVGKRLQRAKERMRKVAIADEHDG